MSEEEARILEWGELDEIVKNGITWRKMNNNKLTKQHHVALIDLR